MPLLYKNGVWSPIEFRRPYSKTSYNILMIGNSFCDYFTEELVGVASAAGIDLTVYNIYEAGCAIAEHYKSLKGLEQDPSLFEKYGMWKTDKTGRKNIIQNQSQESLEYCINFPNVQYDFISLQEHFGIRQLPPFSSGEKYKTNLDEVKYIYDWLKEKFPSAKYYWQETWAYEIGHEQGPTNLTEQIEDQEYIRVISKQCAELVDAKIVPSGDAWEKARQNSWLGNEMCIHLNKGNDYYHDGDVGGGQYLNACVWFETLFNRSCVGNTWRPTAYSLLEKKVIAAQEVAHSVRSK